MRDSALSYLSVTISLCLLIGGGGGFFIGYFLGDSVGLMGVGGLAIIWGFFVGTVLVPKLTRYILGQ